MIRPPGLRGAVAALAFLSRLAPGARLDEADLSSATAWMPAVGAALGFICIGPLWLGLLGGHPMVQAWLAVLLLVYFTRALHLDGLTDVCDGVASHLDPERFWEITKDSRIGAFGVAGLILALTGETLLLGSLFALDMFGPAVLALVMGRACALGLGYFGKNLSRPGLGSVFLAGATPAALAFGLGTTLLAGLLLASPLQLAAGLAFAALPQPGLLLLARRVRGLNGDFLGASIISGEVGALLGMLVAG